MKYFVFDVANTLLYKPTLWHKIEEVLQKYQIKIDEYQIPVCRNCTEKLGHV